MAGPTERNDQSYEQTDKSTDYSATDRLLAMYRSRNNQTKFCPLRRVLNDTGLQELGKL